MDNLVKCSICGQTFIAELFDEHKYKIPFKGIKEIPVAYLLDCSTKKKWLEDFSFVYSEDIPR